MPTKLNSEHVIFSKARWYPVEKNLHKILSVLLLPTAPSSFQPPLLFLVYLPGAPLSPILQDRILPNNFDLVWKLLLPGESSADSCTFFKPFLKSVQNCTMTSSLLPNPPHTLLSHLETFIYYRLKDWWLINWFIFVVVSPKLPNSVYEYEGRRRWLFCLLIY